MNKIVLLTVLLALTTAAAELVAWDFESAAVGKLPEGWRAAKTGPPGGSIWQVLVDKTAPSGSHVLAQTSAEAPKASFNLCVAEGPKRKDLDMQVAFKAVAGTLDQGGGLVWRFKDANNYYITRMNPLENNFRVYKVVDGKRTQLASVDVEAPAGQWHTLRVENESNRIKCYLDGKLHLDVQDEAFTQPGLVGLWTKADAVTYFDAFTVQGSGESMAHGE